MFGLSGELLRLIIAFKLSALNLHTNLCFQLPLGKFYLTTSCDMDDAREVFTFDADKVTSVQLGNAHHGKLKYPQAVTSSTENNVNAVLLATTQALQDLKDEVQKVFPLSV